MPEPVEQAEAQVDDSGAMSFEDAMKDALLAGQGVQDDPVADLPPVVAEDPPAPTDAPSTEPQEAAEPPPALAAPETPAAEAAPAPEDDKSLQRIMERESELLVREQAYEESRSQIEDLRSKLGAQDTQRNNFNMDPVSYIKSLAPDMDLKRLAESLWYEKQGQEAPQKYLEQKAATQQNSALAGRIAKIEQGEVERQAVQQQYDAQQQVSRYQGALEAFAATAAEGNYPLVAQMAAKDKGMLANEMFEVARAHAVATQGEVLTPEQVTTALEKRLDFYQFSRPAPQEDPPPPAQGTSLRNQSTQIQPDREPEDPYSDEYLERKAFQAAGII